MNSRPPDRPCSKFTLAAVRWTSLGSAGLCALAVGSSLYHEVAAADGPLGVLLAVAVALVIATSLAVLWHGTLGIASHAEEPHKMALSVCLGGALCLFGIATSAWFLAALIGGASSVQSHQLDYVRELRNTADFVALNDALDEGITATFEAGATAMQASADAESTTGLLSGTRGKSVVYKSLVNLGDSMLATTRTLRGLAHERGDDLARAARNLTEAEHAAAARNEGQFEEAVSRAAGEIAAADKIRLTAAARNFGIGLYVVSVARPVVDGVLKEINNAVTRADDSRREVSVPGFVPMDSKEAVRANPPLLAWTAAIFCELAPFLSLCLLLVLWRNRHDDDEDRHDGAEALPVPGFANIPRSRPTLAAVE
jgi:hypothetical protein